MATKKRKPTGSRSRPAPSARRGVPTASARSGRPPRATAPVPVAPDSALRTWVADHSKGPVVVLSRLPQYVVPVAIVALMAVGLLAPVPVAVVALAAIVTFMAWLAFLSWPVLAGPQRGMRLLAIALIVGAAVGRIAGWF